MSCMAPPANPEGHESPIGPVSYSTTSRGFWDTLMTSQMPLNSYIYATESSSFNSSQLLYEKTCQHRNYLKDILSYLNFKGI